MLVKHLMRCVAPNCRAVVKVRTLQGDVDAQTLRIACKSCKKQADTKVKRREIYVTGGSGGIPAEGSHC